HIARNCTQPKRLQNSKYFKDKMLLMQAQENGVALDAEQALFLAGGPDNAFDDDYVKDNDVSVVHSNSSSVPNDTFMMIYDDMCEPFGPSVSNSSRNAVVKNSLTEREQKINE
nr:retrovirus-related Pol polyprotein from transposon TNT 1-94 [Tanacetum cinerariifolium]